MGRGGAATTEVSGQMSGAGERKGTAVEKLMSVGQ